MYFYRREGRWGGRKLAVGGWGLVCFGGAEGFVVFAHGFGVFFGHGVAIDGLENFGVLEAGEFLTQPRPGFF